MQEYVIKLSNSRNLGNIASDLANEIANYIINDSDIYFTGNLKRNVVAKNIYTSPIKLSGREFLRTNKSKEITNVSCVYIKPSKYKYNKRTRAITKFYKGKSYASTLDLLGSPINRHKGYVSESIKVGVLRWMAKIN